MRFWDSHLGVLGEKSHLDVGSVTNHRVYYKGEGGGFPQVRAVVSLLCPCCPWLVLAPKVLQLCTNHFVWVVCRPVWVNEVPSQNSNMPLYPSKCCELGSVPQSLFLSLFLRGLTFEFLKELGMRHMHTMRLVLWGLHHVQGLNLHQLCQPHHHILLQGLKRCIWLHPSYLLVTIMAILPKKLVNAIFLPRIFFMIIVRKMDIRKLFVLPCSWNESNSNYHGKICQHLLLPLNQKPRHFSLPPMLSPPKVILIIMLRRRNTMLTRGRCLKPMQFKFKLYKMNLNYWGPNLLI
jgi:hypothetical protein